ncbi:MAG: S-layer homology domain-containing protein [Leptolyngbyaceae cyanobacterium]
MSLKSDLKSSQRRTRTKLYKAAIVGVFIAGAWLQGCNRGSSGPDSPDPPITPTVGNCDTFSDVPPDYWASQYIQAAVDLGVTAGYTLETCVDGVAEFKPEAPVTRAEYAALLNQVFSDTPAAAAEPFPDVAETYWAATSIQDAAAKGFILGYDDGLFRPEQPINRSEVLFALVKGLEYAPSGDVATTVSIYDDVEVFRTWTMGSSEALEAIAAATEKDIVINHPDAAKLNPLQPATRSEVAAMIYQALVSAGKADPVQ